MITKLKLSNKTPNNIKLFKNIPTNTLHNFLFPKVKNISLKKILPQLLQKYQKEINQKGHYCPSTYVSAHLKTFLTELWLKDFYSKNKFFHKLFLKFTRIPENILTDINTSCDFPFFIFDEILNSIKSKKLRKISFYEIRKQYEKPFNFYLEYLFIYELLISFNITRFIELNYGHKINFLKIIEFWLILLKNPKQYKLNPSKISLYYPLSELRWPVDYKDLKEVKLYEPIDRQLMKLYVSSLYGMLHAINRTKLIDDDPLFDLFQSNKTKYKDYLFSIFINNIKQNFNI